MIKEWQTDQNSGGQVLLTKNEIYCKNQKRCKIIVLKIHSKSEIYIYGNKGGGRYIDRDDSKERKIRAKQNWRTKRIDIG